MKTHSKFEECDAFTFLFKAILNFDLFFEALKLGALSISN